MKPLIPLTALLLLVLALPACSELTRDERSTAVNLVNQATETVQRFKAMPDLRMFSQYMATARGIVVLPSVIKGGFLFGGEGGSGVLLARTDDGSWSPPAFYALAAASVGLQAGIQDTEIVLILRSDAAIDAVIKHQGKLGADAGLTFGAIGQGAEVSTTTNVGVDILAFSNANMGLFGGIGLEGAVLARRVDLNEAYYGRGVTPKGILYQGQGVNPQADGLRAALSGP